MALHQSPHPATSQALHRRFLSIPQASLCYWLRDRFFDLVAGPTLGDVANVCQRLATGDDDRFVRFVWDVPPEEWARPVRARRWVPFENSRDFADAAPGGAGEAVDRVLQGAVPGSLQGAGGGSPTNRSLRLTNCRRWGGAPVLPTFGASPVLAGGRLTGASRHGRGRTGLP